MEAVAQCTTSRGAKKNEKKLRIICFNKKGLYLCTRFWRKACSLKEWFDRYSLPWGVLRRAKKVGKNFGKSLAGKSEFSIFVVPCPQKKGWEQVLWINDEVVAHRRERSRQKPSDFDWVFEETGLIFKGYLRNEYYYEEFDPGSGWTLAGGLTHASWGAA